MPELVVRRIGGLEKPPPGITSISRVVRRIGGLEILQLLKKAATNVVRRIGGLEIEANADKHIFQCCPPYRRLRKTNIEGE